MRVVAGIVVAALLTVGVRLWSARYWEAEAEALLRSVSVTYVAAADAAPVPGSTSELAPGSDTVTAVTFKICNNGYQPVGHVEFEAHIATSPDSSANTFRSDSLLAQAGCADQTWTGQYVVGDTVEAVVRVVVRARR